MKKTVAPIFEWSNFTYSLIFIGLVFACYFYWVFRQLFIHNKEWYEVSEKAKSLFYLLVTATALYAGYIYFDKLFAEGEKEKKEVERLEKIKNQFK
jgi:uncharacterized membrane protein